ncbi:unannotated protein [freshwater metagenome]|uniref:Unannotated protein n=1 Tax=freshwater metagenome TaxID=449393 RepID=A0A6J7RA52_9ZZZZ
MSDRLSLICHQNSSLRVQTSTYGCNRAKCPELGLERPSTHHRTPVQTNADPLITRRSRVQNLPPLPTNCQVTGRSEMAERTIGTAEVAEAVDEINRAFPRRVTATEVGRCGAPSRSSPYPMAAPTFSAKPGCGSRPRSNTPRQVREGVRQQSRCEGVGQRLRRPRSTHRRPSPRRHRGLTRATAPVGATCYRTVLQHFSRADPAGQCVVGHAKLPRVSGGAASEFVSDISCPGLGARSPPSARGSRVRDARDRRRRRGAAGRGVRSVRHGSRALERLNEEEPADRAGPRGGRHHRPDRCRRVGSVGGARRRPRGSCSPTSLRHVRDLRLRRSARVRAASR